MSGRDGLGSWSHLPPWFRGSTSYASEPGRLLVSGKSAPQLPLTRPLVWRLPDPEFLDQIRRRYDPPQDAWRVPELLELLLPIMRADMGVCDTYVYGDEPPFDFPIVACGGVDDREAPIEELDAWREQTNSTISLHAFPGGHFYINRVLPKLRSLLAAEMASFAAGEGRGGGPAIT